MDEYVKRELERKISSFSQLPYLFVGTGISMRYSNAPSWDTLLKNIWKMAGLGDSDREYEKMKQKIENEISYDKSQVNEEDRKYYVNPLLATEIEKTFNEKYYSEAGYDEKIFDTWENDEIIDKHYNPFKYLIAKQTKELELDINRPEYDEVQYLIQNQNKIAGVITTNYDGILENIFKDFSVMVGQDNLLASNMFSIFEIFKIHGDCKNPESIILTQSDYKKFDYKLKYLSAKLMTIFIEHPIIFVGYGMGDVNIRNILMEIAECLNDEQLSMVKDNFLFISPAFGKDESYNTNTLSWGRNSISIHEFVIKDYGELYKSLAMIQNSMPVKIARKLQNMVCNYVYSAEAQNNVIFGDVNSPDIDDDKVAIYFGKQDTVTHIGFSQFDIDDILEDVLYDNKPYLVNIELINDTFKNIRSRSGATILPVYKYLNKLNLTVSDIPDNYNIIKGYSDPNIRPTSSDIKNYIKNSQEFFHIYDIESTFPNHIPKQVANIKKSAINISTEELGDYIKKYYGTDQYQKHKSLFRKLIALYDYEKYGIN